VQGLPEQTDHPNLSKNKAFREVKNHFKQPQGNWSASNGGDCSAVPFFPDVTKGYENLVLVVQTGNFVA